MSIKIFDKIRQNHWLMMIVCCLVPIIIAGILFYFGFKKYAIFALILLCPIMHYFLMKDMHGKCDEKNKVSSTKVEGNLNKKKNKLNRK